MAKTRGVFALITRGKNLLLSERMDGKGWNLPGGRVKKGESNQVALVREVKEETGLDVKVLHHVGPDHVSAVAYACKVIGGELKSTTEAKKHAWVNAQEVRQGYFYNTKYKGIGNRTFGNKQKIYVRLVGPEGRLGRTGRMVWDAFSLMKKPKRKGPPYILRYLGSEFGMPEFEELAIGEVVCQNAHFFTRAGNGAYVCWPRLDPYSPTGEMRTK